jgi:hypothetical protein
MMSEGHGECGKEVVKFVGETFPGVLKDAMTAAVAEFSVYEKN